MIKIREDFEKFYDDFIEFSRDFYVIKGRVKSYQQKVRKRVKKLLEWNDMNPAQM